MGLYFVIIVSGLARRLSTYRLGAKQTWAVEQDLAKNRQDCTYYYGVRMGDPRLRFGKKRQGICCNDWSG